MGILSYGHRKDLLVLIDSLLLFLKCYISQINIHYYAEKCSHGISHEYTYPKNIYCYFFKEQIAKLTDELEHLSHFPPLQKVINADIICHSIQFLIFENRFLMF